jgi:hypothetical protein
MPATTDGTEVSHPTALVRAAVEALATQFFEPLAVADLLRDAWAGATAALLRAGVAPIQLSRLLLNEGRLFTRLRHDEVHLADGTVLPMRQDVDLDDLGQASPCGRSDDSGR